MTFHDDWRTSFPGVDAATRFIEAADDYRDRMKVDPGRVVAEIRERRWAEAGHEGVPQPDLDEIRRLFARVGEAIEAGDLEAAEEFLDDVVAFCMPDG